jgi:Ca2+-binding EF-hand superfamily protein
MAFRCVVLTLALLVGVVISEASIETDEKGYFEEIDSDNSKSISKGELLTHGWAERVFSTSWFEKADKDHNSFLAGDELKEKESPNHTFEDLVADGKLHLEEGVLSQEAYHKGVREMWAGSMVSRFDVADRDKNGELTVEELLPLYRDLVKEAKSRYFAMLKSEETNSIESSRYSGFVHEKKFHPYFETAHAFFELSDANSDGTVTLEEYVAHHDKEDPDNVKKKFDSMIQNEVADRTKLTSEMFLSFMEHESRTYAKSSWEKIDTDNDGFVSEQEWHDAATIGVKLEL